MRRPLPLILVVGGMALLPSLAGAVTVTPLLKLSALGGQYFTGDTHSTGANIDGSAVPVIGLNSRLYLIPIYLFSYHETQSVYSFLGENTLISRQLDQTFVLRSAWAIDSSWRLKPRAGYKREWIKQSDSEELATGLFNYSRVFGGVSVEKVLANGSVELGYEYGGTRYPNYQSLLSDPRLTTTGITSGAGQDVLNFNSHETSLLFQRGKPDDTLSLGASFTWIRESFRDQKIISTDANGFESFEGTQRTDDIFVLSLSPLWRPNSQWAFGAGVTLQDYLSNQNAFDATQLFTTPFTYRYYNFVDVQWTPAVTYYDPAKRWDLTLGGTLGYRRYSHRRAQDGLGTYTDSLIHSMNRGGSLTARYKIVKGLYAVLTGNVLTYSSNTRYEANYPYNYTVWTYLGGLSWEY